MALKSHVSLHVTIALRTGGCPPPRQCSCSVGKLETSSILILFGVQEREGRWSVLKPSTGSHNLADASPLALLLAPTLLLYLN